MAKLDIKTSEALEGVRALRKGLQELEAEAKDGSGAEGLERRLKRLKDAAGQTIHQFKALDGAMSKNSTTTKKSLSPYDKLIAKFKRLDKLTKNLAVKYGRYNKYTLEAARRTRRLKNEIDKISRSTQGATSKMSKFNKIMGPLVGLIGFQMVLSQVISLGKGIFELTKKLNAFSFAMKAILKDEGELIQTQQWLKEMTNDFGAEIISTTNRYIKFRTASMQAGLSLKDTQKIFGTMTKAAGVLGLQTDELTSIFLALEQMVSKGKITTEELRRQLGERLPGAMDIMAKAVGVSTAELDAMMKKGEIISKEVLPRFAEEVQKAFGLESITAIETLAAAQIRLGNAWTALILAFESGEGRISKPIMALFGNLTDILRQIEVMNRTEQVWLDIARATGYKDAIASVNGQLKIYNEKSNERIKSLSKLIKKNERSIKSELTGLREKNRLLELNKDILKEIEDIRIDQMVDTDIVALDLAKAGLAYNAVNIKINEQEKAVELLTKAHEEGKIVIWDITKAVFPLYEEGLNVINNLKLKGIKTSENTLLSLKKEKAFLLGNIDAYKAYFKQLEEGGDDVDPKKQKVLRIILDLEKQIQVERLKSQVESNRQIIDSEQTTFDERIRLARENVIKLNEITDLELDAVIERINAKAEKEKLANTKLVEDGTLSAKKAGVQLLKIKEETLQKIEIATLKSEARLVANEESFINQIDDIHEDWKDKQIDEASFVYDAKLAILNQELILEETTAKRKKEIEKEMTKIAIESANAQIKAAIMIAEVKIKIGEIMGRDMSKIRNELDLLKQSLKGMPNDLKTTIEKLVEVLEFLGEALHHIGNIADGIFENRIQNIEAEIIAEEEKYDRLLELASDDAAQSASIRREKDAAIKRLEDKRLREEQRQAKVRKLFAIAEIKINTAIAVSKVWGQTGIFGIAAEIPVLIMGALQIGAVLATPIPKYVDGLDRVSRSHIGMINDGVDQEYIKRGNTILTTTKKDAIVSLKPGDAIYENYEKMNRKTMLLSGLLGGVQINQSDFNLLFDNISKSITDGWRSAKIQSNVKIMNNVRDNSYRDSLSRWN